MWHALNAVCKSLCCVAVPCLVAKDGVGLSCNRPCCCDISSAASLVKPVLGVYRRAGCIHTARRNPPVSPPLAVLFQLGLTIPDPEPQFSYLIAHMENRSNFRWNGTSSENRKNKSLLREKKGDTIQKGWQRMGSKRKTTVGQIFWVGLIVQMKVRSAFVFVPGLSNIE